MSLSELSHQLELPRRLVHASGVCLPAGYLAGFLTWAEVGILLLVGTVVVLALEFARLRLGFTHYVYEKLTRPYEQHVVAGYALYVVGMLVAWVVFDPTPALLGMLMLAIGDPVSGMIGNSVGDDGWSWYPPVGMGLVCLLIAVPVVVPAYGAVNGAVVAVAAAVCAVVADEVKPTLGERVVDDNLTIPLYAAAGATVITYIL